MSARERDLPNNTGFPSLQGSNDSDAAIDVDRSGSEGEDFGNPGTAEQKCQTKQTIFKRSPGGRFGKSMALGAVQILTPARGTIKREFLTAQMLMHLTPG